LLALTTEAIVMHNPNPDPVYSDQVHTAIPTHAIPTLCAVSCDLGGRHGN